MKFAVERKMDILMFEVAGSRYGLPIEHVSEVALAVPITPFPRNPPFVEGVINVRGQIVPVLDWRARFALAPKAFEPTDHLVIASGAQRPVAIRVDRILELKQLEATELEPAVGIGVEPELLTAIGRLPDGLVLIHDVRAFLDRTGEEALKRALRRPPKDATR